MSTSPRPRRRRSARVTAAVTATVTAAATLSLGASASAVPATTDPRPVAVGGSWLAGELTDGVMHNPQFGFDDYGLSIDAGFALAEVGGHDAAVTAILDAVTANLDGYTTGAEFGSPDDVYASSVAKALAFLESQGRDGTDAGGVDLVTRLEDRTATSGPATGRISDSTETDYANTIGQAFAAQGLTLAGSGLADEATAYLLKQQCAAGFFRLALPASDAATQTCDAGSGEPSPDVTALAALALLDQTGAPAVDLAVTRAADWLAGEQRGNGSLGGDPPTTAANANSTGLAGWLFTVTGRDEAARKAAGWLRGLQADEVAPCTTGLTPETGAVAYDLTGYRGGRRDGVTDASSDQFRRASAQALPALAAAPDGRTRVSLAGPKGFVKAGSRQRFVARGLAAGETACVRRLHQSMPATAGVAGVARSRLRMPGGTTTRAFVVRTHGSGRDRHAVTVLGRTRLGVAVRKATPARRRAQVARATGLEPGEKVRLRYRGRIIARGRANDRGAFRDRFFVGRRTGDVRVVALGHFGAIRRGATSFEVR